MPELSLIQQFHKELLDFTQSHPAVPADDMDYEPDDSRVDWQPGLSQKQKRLIWEMREFAAGLDWADRNGLRYLQRSIGYGLNQRLFEFLALDKERERQSETNSGK